MSNNLLMGMQFKFQLTDNPKIEEYIDQNENYALPVRPKVIREVFSDKSFYFRGDLSFKIANDKLFFLK